MRIATVLASLLVAVAACSSSLPPPPDPSYTASPRLEDRPHRPSDRTKLLEELQRQHARWNKEAPLSYRLTVAKGCFCDAGVPWVSDVDGVDVTSSRGGYRRDGSSIGPPLRRVEQLFAEAERAASSNADEVQVAFDPTFGFPTHIRIDEWRGVADDETEWIVSLKVLQ